MSVDVPEPNAGSSTKPRAPLWALAIGTFGGVGFAPKAPGTFGSLASLVIWAPLVLLDVAWWVRGLAVLAIFALGVVAADVIVRVERREDPQIVVADEVAGMGITLLFAAHGGWSLALGFVLFRVFDIAKPWPVSLADRRIKGGFGAMFDDALAGAYALAVLVVIERFALPPLLERFTAS